MKKDPLKGSLPIILGIETAGTSGSAALWFEGNLTERRLEPGVKHSDGMLGMIEELLSDHSLTIKDLTGIAFGMGPGSFTGIRIACGITQGLAFAHQLPVVGINTLLAMAQKVHREYHEDVVIPILDARMQEIFAGAYEYADHEWQERLGPTLTSIEHFRCPSSLPWQVVGSFPQAEQIAEKFHLKPAISIEADATAIVELSLPYFKRNQTLKPEEAQPLYIRNKVALTMAEQKSNS